VSINGKPAQEGIRQLLAVWTGMKTWEFANKIGEEGWELAGTLHSELPERGQLVF